MVFSKTRWKWHQSLQMAQKNHRQCQIDLDSESDNEESIDDQQQQNCELEANKSMIESEEDIFNTHQKLKNEATMALVFGAKMARMQIQLERESLVKKRRLIYEIIGLRLDADRSMSRSVLDSLNIGQLHILVNELIYQIEEHNEALIRLLMERDSLSMAQDSLLVDIEDFDQRLQERTFQSSKSRSYVYVVQRRSVAQEKQSIFHHLFPKSLFIGEK